MNSAFFDMRDAHMFRFSLQVREELSNRTKRKKIFCFLILFFFVPDLKFCVLSWRENSQVPGDDRKSNISSSAEVEMDPPLDGLGFYSFI